MWTGHRIALASLASLTLAFDTQAGHVDPRGQVELVHPFEERYVLLPAPGTAKAEADTIWFADWSFDAHDGCDEMGWQSFDGRIRNNGSHHWQINDVYSGIGHIVGSAAVLTEHNRCWVYPDGYGNDWDNAIRILYRGATSLSFDYLIDCERSYDALSVEADSACASHASVNYDLRPDDRAEQHRIQLYSDSGLQLAGRVDSLALPDFGAPQDTHCVWLRFLSDRYYSQEDGAVPTVLAAGVVIDNVRTWGGSIDVDEDFATALDPNVDFRNSADSAAFGNWGRLYEHITDNDPCAENWSCAWLWSDHITPTQALSGSMEFGPGGYVIHNWLDNIIVSPWTALPSTMGSTVLSFRRFPGNLFSGGRIVQNWDVRTMYRFDNIDTPAPGDSVDCVTPWQRPNSWNSLGTFQWTTVVADLSAYVDAESRAIQVRFRVSDWWLIFGGCDLCGGNPGPGPFIDRVRIGRHTLQGPVIFAGTDTRTQAQDAFPTLLSTSSPGEHHVPSTDRFGTAAFSAGADLGGASTPHVVTSDSITVSVVDARSAGGIRFVTFHAAIVAGPHTGKAPPPWTVGPNGFFEVPADSVRTPSGAAVDGGWYVDLDDEYFRGGDVLVYVWVASDAAGGTSSLPAGLSSEPSSIEEAYEATGGLFEVSFLPRIDWDPSYLSRIAADGSGKLDPTPAELAGSSQATCILYFQLANHARRSGDANRTSFMYSLDALGYRDLYDVYDVQGYGNTNNQLGGRATVAQATGYALLVQDTGRLTATTLPDGLDLETEKVDQAQWYRDWLAGAAQSEAGTVTLWLLGENLVEDKGTHPLIADDCGVVLVSPGQQSSLNPMVTGQTSFTWAQGGVTDFAQDAFTLVGPCPAPRNYDALAGTHGGVVVHRYTRNGEPMDGATVVNANSSAFWNTVLMAFNWFDIHDPGAGLSGTPAQEMMREILVGVLPAGCNASTPTSGPGRPLPLRTKLYPGTPNPFKATIAITFEVQRPGRVRVRVHDVSGRLVRTLVDENVGPGFHRVPWHGLDNGGRRVASGVYFCILQAGDVKEVQRLILLR